MIANFRFVSVSSSMFRYRLTLISIILLHNIFSSVLQIGGKDQMGNIESGHRLIRRLLDKPSYGKNSF